MSRRKKGSLTKAKVKAPVPLHSRIFPKLLRRATRDKFVWQRSFHHGCKLACHESFHQKNPHPSARRLSNEQLVCHTSWCFGRNHIIMSHPTFVWHTNVRGERRQERSSIKNWANGFSSTGKDRSLPLAAATQSETLYRQPSAH
jgi:hypothetical protein